MISLYGHFSLLKVLITWFLGHVECTLSVFLMRYLVSFQVASQFRVILANMNTQFTGIFGHVVSGIEALDKVADIGGEGGRPEKIATVTNCGIYKG